MHMKLLRTVSVDFDVTTQLLIRFFCIHQILEKKMGVQRNSTAAIQAYDSLGGKYCTVFS
jgi:hypothetical protein